MTGMNDWEAAEAAASGEIEILGDMSRPTFARRLAKAKVVRRYDNWRTNEVNYCRVDHRHSLTFEDDEGQFIVSQDLIWQGQPPGKPLHVLRVLKI